MTDAERTAWLALYAAAWHQQCSTVYAGRVPDVVRARYAAEQSTRGLQALRDLSVEVFEGRLDVPDVVEVLT